MQRVKLKENSEDLTKTLVISNRELHRLKNYKTETDKLTINVKKKAENLAKIKEASEEMTKNWSNTFKNIKKRRQEELLSRKQKIEDDRLKLLKKFTDENTQEHAKVVDEARKLILYKKPQVRLINSALRTSEFYRILDAQMKFKKKLKDLEDQQENKYIEKLKEETLKNLKDEKTRSKKNFEKIKQYREDLEKQIENSNNQLKKLKQNELNYDLENLNKIKKKQEMIEQSELIQREKKKEELRKTFFDSLEMKKRLNEEMRQQEERENRYITAYQMARHETDKKTKINWKKNQAEKLKRSELLAEKCALITKFREENAQKINLSLTNEKNHFQFEKLKLEKLKEKIRLDIDKFKIENAEIKKKRDENEKNRQAWEFLQRCKRDEYDKNHELKQLHESWQKKKQMASDLRKQMKEQEIRRKEEEKMDDDSEYVKRALKKTNEKVLAYGQEILNESKGVRPLFPIIKVIEEFKRENKLNSPTNSERRQKSTEEYYKISNIFDN